ncbi:hypothetical protein C8R46DRAFT_466284 [Mycena filopes]|nr:hypothetical protein C8R46DRAFT_466284 [Mycena filopes]
MSTSNGKPSVLEALAEPRRTDPTHQGIALKDIQIPAGRARFEQAISDFASYGSPRSLAPDFRSSSDYTQQTKRRNSSPSRFYSPHRPDAIVSSQPIYYPHPHQNHQFDGEGTPIEPFSEFSRRGRDSSAPSPRKPLPRSRSPVYHEPQPVFAHPDDPYPAHALPPAHVPPSEPPYVSGNPFGLNHQRESIHTSQKPPSRTTPPGLIPLRSTSFAVV